MRYIKNVLRFSPTDLTKYLESEFSSWMDRWSLEKKIGSHNEVVPVSFSQLESRSFGKAR